MCTCKINLWWTVNNLLNIQCCWCGFCSWTACPYKRNRNAFTAPIICFTFFSVHSSLSRCFFILITTSAWKKAFKLHIRCIRMCVTRAKCAYYWLLLTASATNLVICAYKSQKWPVYLNAHQHSTLAGTVSSIWKFHFNVINNNITRPALIIIHDKTFK